MVCGLCRQLVVLVCANTHPLGCLGHACLAALLSEWLLVFMRGLWLCCYSRMA